MKQRHGYVQVFNMEEKGTENGINRKEKKKPKEEKRKEEQWNTSSLLLCSMNPSPERLPFKSSVIE